MATQSREAPGLVAVQTAPVSFTNTNAENTLISYTIPAGSLSVGSTFAIRAYGYCLWGSNLGNLTWRFKLGSVSVFDSVGAQGGTANTDPSNGPWAMHGMFTLRSVGAAGTVYGGAFNRYLWGGTTAKFDVDGNMSGTVNTTAALTIAFTAQMATASTQNLVWQNAGAIELLKL